MGITAFKMFIWGGISSVIWSGITFYGNASRNFWPYNRWYTSSNEHFEYSYPLSELTAGIKWCLSSYFSSSFLFQIEVYKLENTDSVVCLAVKEITTTYHLIRINPSKNVKVVCQTCRSGTCKHVKGLLQQTDNDIVSRLVQYMDENETETPRNVPACLSRSRIPFTYNKEETKADISTCAC